MSKVWFHKASLSKVLTTTLFFAGISLSPLSNSSIFDDIGEGFHDFGEALVGVGEDIADTAEDVGNSVASTATTVGDTVVDFGEQAIDTVEQTTVNLGEGAIDVANDLKNEGEEFGEGLVDDLEILGGQIIVGAELATADLKRLAAEVTYELNAVTVNRTAGLSTDQRRRLALQHQIDFNLPLAASTWIGTHNTYNALDSRYPLPNQNADIIEQLANGFRALSFDVYQDNTTTYNVLRLCHAICSGIETTFAESLTSLSNWLSAHPNEVVILILEYGLNANDRNLAAVEIERTIGHQLYSPKVAFGSTSGACHSLPVNTLSKRDVLAKNKQVIITTYAGCGDNGPWRNYVWDFANKGYMADAAFSQSNLRSASHMSLVFEDRSVFGADLFCGDLLNISDAASIARLVEGTGVQIPGVSSSDIQAMFDQCRDEFQLDSLENAAALALGASVIGLDYGVDINRADGLIWSWADGYPQGGQQCALSDAGLAVFNFNDRWRSVSCDYHAPIACANAGNVGFQNHWQIVSSGRHSDGASLCSSRGLEYRAPLNANENMALTQAKKSAGVSEALINYHRTGNATWNASGAIHKQDTLIGIFAAIL